MKTFIGSLLSICCFCACGADDAAVGKLPLKTTVSATLDIRHEPGQNLIWCNTFQLAWNALGTDWCGEKLRLKGATEFENSLNASTVKAKDIDAESVLIKVGKLTPAFIDSLNGELKKRYGDDGPTELKKPDDGLLTIMAYAYLKKTLSFKKPFDKLKEPVSWLGAEGTKVPVEAFGIAGVTHDTPRELTQQIQILSEERGEYIIELKTESQQDRLILALVPPETTLKGTVESVRKRIAAAKRTPFAIQSSDQFRMPCIQIALDRVYHEIIDKEILNKKLEGFVISRALQSIRFNLNEKGMELKSEAVIHAKNKNGHKPRRILFDRPFLLYVERARAENPYLAIWLENPNLFVKSTALPIEVKPPESKK